MFKLVSHSIWDIFFQNSKFIFSLEKWTSRILMNNIIDDSLNRWHLMKFIKSHKNEVMFNDCLKHFHRMRIRECHLAKQRFACIIKLIIVQLVLLSLRSATSDRLTSKELTLCRLNVVIDLNRARICIEKKSSVLRSLMKYWSKTWYYRVERDCNTFFENNFHTCFRTLIVECHFFFDLWNSLFFELW